MLTHAGQNAARAMVEETYSEENVFKIRVIKFLLQVCYLFLLSLNSILFVSF